MSGNLYIVATPIGNLEDMTLRAVRVLKEVDLIAAEDTRHSRGLLQYFGIKTSCTSVHQFNEQKVSKKIIDMLRAGKNVALISDAGTPLVSDPGYRLMAEAIAADIKIVPIPGACAAITALSAAGLSADEFLFIGFLPAKSSARQQKLTELKSLPFTLIFYEAPHRLLATLQDLVQALGVERRGVIGRELTKTFESILRGTVQELKNHFEAYPAEVKGEFVILIEGETKTLDAHEEQAIQILKILMAELPIKQAVKLASQLTDVARNKLYQIALKLPK